MHMSLSRLRLSLRPTLRLAALLLAGIAANPSQADDELLANGDFSKLAAGASLSGWRVTKGTLQTVDGVSTLVLDGSYASAAQKLKIDPAWTLLELKAKVRARDVVVGDQNWKDARVVLNFRDDAGKQVGPWPPVINARGTTDWQETSRTCLVPKGATTVEVLPANFGASGQFQVQYVSLKPLSQTLAPDAPRPVIVLKLDDLTAITPRWQRVIDFLAAEKIPAAFGIIGNCLDKPDPKFVAWVKDLHEKHGIELWNHGYKNRSAKDPKGEFEGDSVEEQLASLEATQRLVKENIGVELHAFGPHWSGTNKATVAALKQVPAIKAVFYYTPGQEAGWFVFQRHFDLENPIFKPNSNFVIAQYEAQGNRKPYLCFQGHPNQWTDEAFEQFKLTVQYLKAQGCIFMTPSGYLAARAAGKLPAAPAAPAKP